MDVLYLIMLHTVGNVDKKFQPYILNKSRENRLVELLFSRFLAILIFPYIFSVFYPIFKTLQIRFLRDFCDFFS